MRLRHAHTISAFLGGEHAVEEMIAVALEYVADALHLDEIATEANKDAAGREREIHGPKNQGFMRAFISRTASSMPVNSARLIRL